MARAVPMKTKVWYYHCLDVEAKKAVSSDSQTMLHGRRGMKVKLLVLGLTVDYQAGVP